MSWSVARNVLLWHLRQPNVQARGCVVFRNDSAQNQVCESMVSMCPRTCMALSALEIAMATRRHVSGSNFDSTRGRLGQEDSTAPSRWHDAFLRHVVVRLEVVGYVLVVWW